jgi:hypothetical protein
MTLPFVLHLFVKTCLLDFVFVVVFFFFFFFFLWGFRLCVILNFLQGAHDFNKMSGQLLNKVKEQNRAWGGGMGGSGGGGGTS